MACVILKDRDAGYLKTLRRAVASLEIDGVELLVALRRWRFRKIGNAIRIRFPARSKTKRRRAFAGIQEKVGRIPISQLIYI